jgi:type IV fimbrial biogenesis protein FimT
MLIYVLQLFVYRQPSPMKKHSGFTLIELMVTVAILAILLAVGVPSFRSMVENNRIRAVGNDLVVALQFARSEAIKRGASVTLCSSDDQASCSGAWTDGWVARDEAAAADPPFRVWPTPREGVAIAVPGSVVFNALGGAANDRCFTVTLNTLTRFVGVSPSGRVASSTTACP